MLRGTLFLPAILALAYGLPEILEQCETASFTLEWHRGYNATLSFSAPSSYSSVTLNMNFLHPVNQLSVQGCTVSKTDDTHFVLTAPDSGSQGDPLTYDYQVSYIHQQPLLGQLLFNGDDVCGPGGSMTTSPPLTNPCDATGTKPYDYPQVLCMAILFYEAQRSGRIPDDQRLTWRWDSAMDDGSDVGHDLSGGYYDAGDFVKFGFPMAWTATVLAWGVIAYEDGYRAAGELDHAREAVKWVADYLLKAHTSSEELWGQVGDGELDHEYWGRPEQMGMDRPSEKIDAQHPGSDLAGETAAALAAASIVFSDDASYSKWCLDAAKELYQLADDHRGIYTDSITGAREYYDPSSGYGDELAWGAIWLYKATGASNYLDAAKAHWDEFKLGERAFQFSWDDKTPGCYALFAELDGGDTYTSALTTFVDQTMDHDQYTPGGLVYLDMWGCLRHAMNVAFIANRAADLGFKTHEYRKWAMGQLDYVLGSSGRSYIVGYGENPPLRPQHRSSSCPQYPASCGDGWPQRNLGPNPHTLYGAMVGGPDSSDNFEDDRMDDVHSNVACDYNAGLSGVLAAAVQNM